MEKAAQAHTTTNGTTSSPLYFMCSQRLRRTKKETNIFKGLFPLFSAPLPFLTTQVTETPQWESRRHLRAWLSFLGGLWDEPRGLHISPVSIGY